MPPITDEPSNSTVLRQAREAERRADEAVASAELILSLLEGASFLVTVALGAAALFGFQEIRNTRKQIDEKMKLVNDTLKALEPYKPQLEGLDQLQRKLARDIKSVIRLLQAYQEFTQTQNYDIAYRYAHSVLNEETEGMTEIELDTNLEIMDNVVALYMAGWLEVHHQTDKLDEGIEHLKRATEMEPKWSTVRASYGVGLRRKAIHSNDPIEKRNFFKAAEDELIIALQRSPSLTDFNKESFHGPLGGIYRDTGRIKEAVAEYELALRITPGSSYPKGNLASLYLWQASRENDPKMMKLAMKTFQDTYKAATSELREAPSSYYLLMDLAMSKMVVSHEDQSEVAVAFEHLDEALYVEASCGMLEVSLGGWERLLEYAPATDDWYETREHIRDALMRVHQKMQEAGCRGVPGI